MELIPSEPPGNAKRKLRGLVEEIVRLRQQGYSIRVIHETLNKAGVQVSRSTVHRELSRPLQAASMQRPPQPAHHAQTEAPACPAQTPSASLALDIPQSELVPQTMNKMSDVDAFFSRHITNPLLRKKASS